MIYIIAKSGIESMLTTKELWDKHPDDYLNVVFEFYADSIEEAKKIYEKVSYSISK